MCSACQGQSESDKPYHVCILTVSDTSSQDPISDKSGPLLNSLLSEHGRFAVLETAIVPDVSDKIRAQVEAWTERSEVQLILTTGGTGFAPSDVTPEAVAPLIVKQAPGLTHLMLSSSLKITQMAALGRPICGLTKQNCMIVTLPGSPKGAKENLEALLPILPHALKLAGGTSSRALHANGAPSANHESSSVSASSHACAHSHPHLHQGPKSRSHKTHDPSKGASARNRSSPYPIIPMSEALDLIFRHTSTLEPIWQDVPSSASSLRGHVLAEDVYSSRTLPSTNSTNVDGYAVHTSDGVGEYEVWTAHTHPMPLELPRSVIYRVNTGGPVPSGANAIVMVEDTEVVSTLTMDGVEEEKIVRILVQVEEGENMRKPGSDVKKGDLVLSKGSLISECGGELGTLHFIGHQEVKVHRKPTVAILSTGNELVDLGEEASSSTAIIDTNRPALRLLLEAAGYPLVDLGIARDDVASVSGALKQGALEADVIIATGGTSMGEVDLLKPVIERELDGTIHFGRVAMKPGKPTTFATIPASRKDCLVFSLPGNPASALVTYNLFVLPSLRKLSGYSSNSWELKRIKVLLTSDLQMDAKRPEFHRVHVRPNASGELEAVSTGGQRSSKASSMALANGLVCLPSKEQVNGFEAKQGGMADCILLGAL